MPITSVVPATAHTGTAARLTITGTGLFPVTRVYLRSSATNIDCSGVTATPDGTTVTALTDPTAPPNTYDVVVSVPADSGDTEQAAPAALTIGAALPVVGTLWDSAHWDATDAEWMAGPPPDQGWGNDWRWFYQRGTDAFRRELAGMIVEARWTTDSHTLGDGTFRGDLQPGSLTLRLWDPEHQLDGFDNLGCMYALYKPTGAMWYWFYESFTRGLVAPGDPQGADCVFVGTTWPNRLTSESSLTNFPSTTVAARLAAIVSALNAAPMFLPPWSGSIAAQSQTMTASPLDTSTGLYPGFLAAVRDAASNGYAWVTAAEVTPGGAGRLVLNYARWDTANQRILDRSQIIAGPATTQDFDWLVTWVRWAAVVGSTGVQSTYNTNGTLVTQNGWQGPGPMRLWGSVISTGPEYVPVFTMSGNLIASRSYPVPTLSSVSLQSGARTTKTGGATSAVWDPRAHVFAPTDVVTINDDAGIARLYRVTKSDHRLTARLWETTHTLETYAPATALP